MKQKSSTISSITLLLMRVLALAIPVACVQKDIEPTLNPHAIHFHSEASDDLYTRAAGTNTDAPYTVKSMGIFAAYTVAPWDPSALLDFMNDLPVERNNATEPWHYSPEQLWPGTGYLSIFAYAPHRENPLYGSNAPLVEGISGVPQITYTVAPTHDQQVDLLIATPLKDQTKCDYLTIPLRHALTKIAFSARVATPTAGTTCRITEILLSNLRCSGSIVMDGSNRTWTLTSSTADYTQNIGNQGIKDLPLTATYQSITPTEGHLFLMPQQLADNVSVTFTYEINTNGTITTESQSFQLNRAITRWNPGDAYNLMFCIGSTLIVAPTPWSNTTVQTDIKNLILNVTRVDAPVYPGVATRIHFWSNQPKDSVYVRTVGNRDLAQYPTGAAYTVDDLFQDLSGKGAANLHYNGFDGVTTASGEGYIDVWHKLDAATGNPLAPLVNGDKRHVWLNASGLTRNIRLNSVIGANSTTTPYVGTFHRWDETGERMVTWGAPYRKWTAEVVDEPAPNSILIDRQPSPFMSTGQLYGNGDVGNPESAQLHPDSTIRVSGMGRVYFRVGWSSTLANRGTAPRYGRIQVVEYNADGVTPSVTRFLYIRQGELEDYLMRKDETGTPGSTLANRIQAKRWSPYNLTSTAPATNDGTPVAVNGGKFVAYPSQAGALFQFVNTGFPRYAFAPILPNAKPVTFELSSIANGEYWSTLKADYETCPPNYRRPNSGLTNGVDASGGTAVGIGGSEMRQSLFLNPTSTTYNSTGNSLFGYYADGFFDRRQVVNGVNGSSYPSKAVSTSNADVAYIGRVMYNPITLASLFFPTPGYRSNTSPNTGNLINTGFSGGYYSSTSNTAVGAWVFQINFFSTYDHARMFEVKREEGYSIRCIRDE